MSDHRSLREKLSAMAERGTEHEREIARAKLAAMGESPPPPRPPTRNAAGAPQGWDGFGGYTSSTGGQRFVFHGPNGERVEMRVTGARVNGTVTGTGW